MGPQSRHSIRWAEWGWEDKHFAGVKLALYGKLSLGRNIAARKYDEFIEGSVHRGKSVIEPLSQCGGLTFTFDKQDEMLSTRSFVLGTKNDPLLKRASQS